MLMNKDLLIDGKEYISAIRASKKIGYASDYIGQLCRSKKISGRLIGKTWYVEFPSLLEHKKNRKLGKRKIVQNSGEYKKISNPKLVESKVNAIVDLDLQNKQTETEGKIDENQGVDVSRPLQNTPRYIPLIPVGPKLSPAYSVLVGQGPKKYALSTLFLVIIIGVSFSFLASSSLSNRIVYQKNQNITTSGETAFVGSVISWVRGLFSKDIENGSVLVSNSSEQNDFLPNGVVILSKPEDQNVITRIKQIFSDEVDVFVDTGNDTGVIKPVFREGDVTKDYAFVLVPVKDKQKNDNVQ